MWTNHLGGCYIVSSNAAMGFLLTIILGLMLLVAGYFYQQSSPHPYLEIQWFGERYRALIHPVVFALAVGFLISLLSDIYHAVRGKAMRRRQRELERELQAAKARTTELELALKDASRQPSPPERPEAPGRNP